MNNLIVKWFLFKTFKCNKLHKKHPFLPHPSKTKTLFSYSPDGGKDNKNEDIFIWFHA